MISALRSTLLAAGVILGMSLPGFADPLSGCSNCFGATYVLQYNPSNTTTGTGGAQIYDVFFTVDTNGSTLAGSWIDSVMIKLASTIDLSQSSLAAAPGGTGNWSGLAQNGLGSNGCSGGNAGAVCTATGSRTVTATPGIYTWEFHYATAAASISGEAKAGYSNVNPTNGHVQNAGLFSPIGGMSLETCGATTSETCGSIPNVPEPSGVILLGSFVVAAASLARKRFA